METEANPEYVIGKLRVLTMKEQTFFYVTNQPTALANLDRDLDTLIGQLESAQAEAGNPATGPIIVRYYPAPPGSCPGEHDPFLMELGVPVKPGTKPAGAAQIKELPPFRCAALLYWGSLAHIGDAYNALMQGIQEAGLERTGEGQEWHYRFEGDSSPNNVLGLHMGIR